MKTVLVTGAGGFLGSYLVEYFLNNGDEVFGVDNFCSSNPNSKHHSKLLKNSNYTFQHIDICDNDFVSSFQKLNFDFIFNFACPASPPIYQSIPLKTMMTCTLGTYNVLSLAKEKTVVIHASTSEVYGDPNVSPQPESYRGNVNSYGPRACYDEGKRAAEALCYDFLKKNKIDVRLVRIFNTYGPRMDPNDGRVITNLVTQALNGKSLTIYGDGLQTRSFCYVTDLIKGIISLSSLSQNPLTPINLGNPTEFSVMQVAQMISQKIGGKIEFVLPAPADDPLQRKPDISLAQKILSWNPTVDLSTGLDNIIRFFGENE